MAITLELSSPEFDKDDLQEQMRQLCLELHDEGFAASWPEGEAQAGHKGIELGAILIAGVPVVSALVAVLTAYVQRAKAVTVKIQKDGKTIEVTANNVAEVESLLDKYSKEG